MGALLSAEQEGGVASTLDSSSSQVPVLPALWRDHFKSHAFLPTVDGRWVALTGAAMSDESLMQLPTSLTALSPSAAGVTGAGSGHGVGASSRVVPVVILFELCSQAAEQAGIMSAPMAIDVVGQSCVLQQLAEQAGQGFEGSLDLSARAGAPSSAPCWLSGRLPGQDHRQGIRALLVALEVPMLVDVLTK